MTAFKLESNASINCGNMGARANGPMPWLRHQHTVGVPRRLDEVMGSNVRHDFGARYNLYM